MTTIAEARRLAADEQTHCSGPEWRAALRVALAEVERLAGRLKSAETALSETQRLHAKEIRELEREARDSMRDAVAFDRHSQNEFGGRDM